MHFLLSVLEWVCLIPVAGGSVYCLLCLIAAFRFRRQSPRRAGPPPSGWPSVTILKPVCGLEKNQKESLRSACLQDYPDYQVVFSAQNPDDPVIPLLKEIQREFGGEKVSVVVEDLQIGTNKKINNMLGAMSHARNDVIVISDSDVKLKPDYLKNIVPPLSDPHVGCVCTLYRSIDAERWFEKLELLTFNADFTPNLIFAYVSGASNFCLGASVAFTKSVLKEIGGFEAVADYLVEDYEMGRRIWNLGKKTAVVPYFVDIVVDFRNFSHWWHHQIYWDQNTRMARPGGFLASVLIRSVPFALLFAALRLGDPAGVGVLGATLALRLTTAAAIMRWGLGDHEGLKSLHLLPARDTASLVSWFLSFTKRTVRWRDTQFVLTRDGRLISQSEPRNP